MHRTVVVNGWWVGTLAKLLGSEVEAVASRLAFAALERKLLSTAEQAHAWKASLKVLTEMGRALEREPATSEWGLVLEFQLPRRAVRPDAVLLAGDVVIPIEFKVGSNVFDRAARLQVVEYALDLRDFHEATHARPVVPMLVATAAAVGNVQLNDRPEPDRAQCVTPSELPGVVLEIWHRYSTTDAGQLDAAEWSRARYRPTPGILETARDVYAGNDVREISASHADNLHATVDAIRASIARAKTEKQRWVCFVTGVPGSGKTLVGLSAVHDTAAGIRGEPLGAYMSGNGPLVDVLRYAIASDLASRTGTSKDEAMRLAKTFIQPVHYFVRELASSETAPPENAIVFDEAQRAWDAEQMRRKQDIPASEAATTLRIMERAGDWAVIVALVGDGQEINTGEAVIEEWFAALAARPQWKALGATEIAAKAPSGAVQTDDALHLDVSVRSPRAAAIADWAGAVVRGDLGKAKTLTKTFTGYPLHLTRRLEELRAYLRDRAGPDRRPGLIASSQARRLRAFGLEMDGTFQGAIEWPHWFVDGPGDIRSSYVLEVAASEFRVPGTGDRLRRAVLGRRFRLGHTGR